MTAPAKPLLKLCCNPITNPENRRARNTFRCFVQKISGCPAWCSFPNMESHGTAKCWTFEKACTIPGECTESVLGKMLIHFTDSQGLFQASETMSLLTEQLLEAKWKGLYVYLGNVFNFSPQNSCTGANSKDWRAGLEWMLEVFEAFFLVSLHDLKYPPLAPVNLEPLFRATGKAWLFQRVKLG